MPHRVVGVVENRFGIDAAGGVDGALTCQQRAEFVERAEIRRPPVQDIDKGLLGVPPPVQRAEQSRALDLGCDCLGPAARRCEQDFELTQPGFLCQPGPPANAGRAIGGLRVLFQCGHGAKVSIAEISVSYYRLIRKPWRTGKVPTGLGHTVSAPSCPLRRPLTAFDRRRYRSAFLCARRHGRADDCPPSPR